MAAFALALYIHGSTKRPAQSAALIVEQAAIVRIEENLRLRESAIAADSNGKIDLMAGR